MEYCATTESTDFENFIPKTQTKLAIEDLLASLKIWKLWSYLAWNDIRMRYRGSVLGPLWITATMLIFISVFSLVYSRLFHQPLNEYIPFLTASYFIWLLICACLTESSNIFLEGAAFISEIKLPYSMYVFRLICRNIIISMHNAVVFILVAIIFKVMPNANLLYFIPAFCLLTINLFACSLLLSMLGTKYRDVPPIIASVIQVLFFVTPISWSPSLLGNSYVIKLNPLYYFFDILRSPLLGQSPMAFSWLMCGIFTIVFIILAFNIFAKYRRDIPFWL
jgi:lipopolysaccharide transport system permease protein